MKPEKGKQEELLNTPITSKDYIIGGTRCGYYIKYPPLRAPICGCDGCMEKWKSRNGGIQ